MSVEKIQRDITNLFNYPSDANPTTQQDYIAAVKNWVETIVNLVDCNLWQPETEYSVGNYLRTPSLPSQVVLRCVTAGISGTEEPDYTDAEIGDTIADGSIEWTIQTMASLNELESYFAEIIQRIENGEGVVDTMWETDLEGDIQPISAENVVPKVNGTGTLGTSLKKWANVYANGLTVSGTATVTTPTAGDDSNKVATTEYVQEEIRQHANMPIGFEYFTMNPHIPQGSLPLFGGEYSRDTYSDLWAWVQEQTGYLKTEAEWQTLSTAHGGNVPYYSDGDGSTTFRVPSLKCWVKGANGTVTEVGSYLEAGLPNIEGRFISRANNGNGQVTITSSTTGAFASSNSITNYSTTSGTTSDGVNYPFGVDFNASRSNAIYGNSTTVQPPSIIGMWLVKAYGVVVDTGQIDEQQYIDDRIATCLPLIGGTMTGTITTSSGNMLKGSGTDNQYWISGGTPYDKGAWVILNGVNRTTDPGAFQLVARNADGTYRSFIGKPDGTMSWSGKEIERVNAIGSNYIRYESGLQIVWGSVPIPAGDNRNVSVTITFPVAFVNTSYAVTFGANWKARTTEYYRVEGLSTTGFPFTAVDVGSNGHNAMYVCIGRWK